MSDDPRPNQEDSNYGDTTVDDHDQSSPDTSGSGQASSRDSLSPSRIQDTRNKINQIKGNQKKGASSSQSPSQNKGHFPDQKDQSRAGIPSKNQSAHAGQQAAKEKLKDSGKQAAKEAAKQTEQAVAKKVAQEAAVKGVGAATGGTSLAVGAAISLAKKHPFAATAILIAALATALFLFLIIPMFIIVLTTILFGGTDAQGQAKALTVSINGPESGSANEYLTYSIQTRSLNPVSNIKVTYPIPDYTRFYSSNPTCVETATYDPLIDPCVYTRSGSSVTAITWNTQATPDPASATYSVTIQVLPGIEDVKIVNLIDAESEEIIEEEPEETESVSGPIP